MADRFLIVDDQSLFRDALQSTIRLAFPDAEIKQAPAVDAARALLAQDSGFQLLLLDLSMPGTKGFEGLIGLRAAFPRLPVVIVSGFEDAEVVAEALACGASGFIPKSVKKPELAEAIRTVMTGSVYVPAWFSSSEQRLRGNNKDDLIRRLKTLTPQQMQVLELVRAGKLNKQIAHELQVGETTAKAHVSEILRKLNVRSRTMAVTEVAHIDLPQIVLDCFMPAR